MDFCVAICRNSTVCCPDVITFQDLNRRHRKPPSQDEPAMYKCTNKKIPKQERTFLDGATSESDELQLVPRLIVYPPSNSEIILVISQTYRRH